LLAPRAPHPKKLPQLTYHHPAPSFHTASVEAAVGQANRCVHAAANRQVDDDHPQSRLVYVVVLPSRLHSQARRPHHNWVFSIDWVTTCPLWSASRRAL
jgi:hypothetical protein